MDIKLYSLCKQEVPETEKGKACIFRCVKEFFPECEGYSAFTSQKRMLISISQSLRAADIVIVAVQNNMYNATKRLLCSALGMRMSKSADIAAKLDAKLSAGKIKQATYDANVMFPADAQVFVTDSGINSGFALTSGGQHIIYLPIEAPRCEEVVYGSVYDYLAEIGESDKTDAAMERRHNEIIERTAEKLNESSVKVAIHSEMMRDFIASRTDRQKLNSGFVFDDEIPAREEQEINDFYVYTARDLRDRHHAQYGVVFSKAYKDDESEQAFVIASIADEKGTNVFKYRAEADETAEELFAVAVDKTMLMLYDYGETLNAEYTDVPDENDRKLRRSAALLTAAAVGATTIIGLITALIYH